MKRMTLPMLALLTIGAAPAQQDLPHCHVWGPFVLFFERGSAALDSRSREVLDYTMQVVTVGPCWDDGKIVLLGHTETGERDALARARARAALDYLLARGLATNRMRIETFGSRYPRRGGDASVPNAENRRVEILPDFR